MPIETNVLPVRLPVTCSDQVFAGRSVTFSDWAPMNYLVGPNGSGKTTFFNAIMREARIRWPNRVKILGTGRLGPLEKSVTQWVGDTSSRLFQEESIDNIYNSLFSGIDTAHQAFQILEKRLDLQIRVLGFLRHVFKRSLKFKSTRRGLVVLGASDQGQEYQIVDECHGLKELVTILTFLYDDTFSVFGIDEPELHLHPQFQRFLLDELKSVAGDPSEPGKKLIFLVTHSPILLELRTLTDLASILVFAQGDQPKRATPEHFNDEEKLKVRQALPFFNAAQRELLFSSVPVLVEGPTDVSILMNVASRLAMPLGAAGIGLTSMGGKYQLTAFRALMSALAKPSARFILDLDAVIDTKTLRCLDRDPRVLAFLRQRGIGERSLTRLVGELIGLLRSYVDDAFAAGHSIGTLQKDSYHADSDLATILRVLSRERERSDPDLFQKDRVETILWKVKLLCDAAKAGNVLILSRGAIEDYFEQAINDRPSDFEKQQALQAELDRIWTTEASAVESRYTEILSFFRDAGFLQIPLEHLTREPLADLIHTLQTEILAGRIRNLSEGCGSSRLKAEGYWDICTLTELSVTNRKVFAGVIKVKPGLGGETLRFDNATRAYEITQPDVQSSSSNPP